MNYRGKLLAAHPKRTQEYLRQSVIIISEYHELGSWGLQLNWPHRGPISFSTIIENQGMWINFDHPVYFGGQYNLTRCFLLHSLDWSSTTTIPLTDQLGITGDLSVLAAIVDNQGPEKYRPIIGAHKWGANELQQELTNQTGVEDSWLVVDATADLVFNYQEKEQWQTVISVCGQSLIDQWI